MPRPGRLRPPTVARRRPDVKGLALEFRRGPSRSGLLAGLALIAVLGLPRTGPAELVYFQDGTAVQLPAEVDGEAVRLLGPTGPLDFRREDFREVVPGHWPDRDWPAVRDRALRGDAGARYEAAWWALDRGLTPEAVAMLRSAHEADPALEPVARLVALLDRLETPAESPDLSGLRAALPGGDDLTRSARGRLVLLHRLDAAEAGRRLDLLDRVLTTFYLTFTALGFDLEVPAGPLVAVCFAEEADYLAYLREEAGEAFLSTRGYYHPTRRVVFSYDGRGRADARRAEAAAQARLDELARAEAVLTAAPPGSRVRLAVAGGPGRALDRASAARELDRLRREARRDDLVRELDRLRVDQGAAVHELIHQLVIDSGLAPRYDRFPVWLHEGIAMQFEGFRGHHWAGLGAVPGHRLDQWRRLDGTPDLLPVLRDEGFGRGYVADRYAAAWGLVYHLRTRQPGRFVAFLDRLRNPDDDKADRVAVAFRVAVAEDLSAFSAGWAADLDGLRTPIEAEAPAPSRRRRRRLPRHPDLVQ